MRFAPIGAAWLVVAGCGRSDFLIPPVEPCAEVDGNHACEFVVARFLHLPRNEKDPDGLVIANASDEVAEVQVYRTVHGQPVEAFERERVAPGETALFELHEGYVREQTSMRTRDGTYVVHSDRPVAASLFSPWTNRTANDASLVLPTGALGTEYVIPSYAPFVDLEHIDQNGAPSYFEAIALRDDTRVTWRSPGFTGSADGVPAGRPGEATSATLSKFERIRVAGTDALGAYVADISGTVVESSAPVLVVGAVGCAYVPVDIRLCDHLQEILLPVDLWSTDYVAPAPPRRASEPTLWRLFAGSDDIEISSSPLVPELPRRLAAKGDFVEILLPALTNVDFHADGPFMPVQYMVSTSLASWRGDPSMVQLIPPSRWRNRHAFNTAVGFEMYFAQVVRETGGASVAIDERELVGWEPLGAFEYIDWPIAEGEHLAESGGPFALSLYAWSNGLGSLNRYSSYALVGGFD